jgi:hypothetical protein
MVLKMPERTPWTCPDCCGRCVGGWPSRSGCSGLSNTHASVRKPILNHGGRFFHVANVEAADDLEDDLRALLTEAYLDAG